MTLSTVKLLLDSWERPETMFILDLEDMHYSVRMWRLRPEQFVTIQSWVLCAKKITHPTLSPRGK